MSAAAALLADCQKKLDRARGGGGWFNSQGGIDHGTYRSVVAPYHDRVYHEGRVAWAALVLAQPDLYSLGDWDSTGTVVYSFDRVFDANPNLLERVAASVGALKNAMPKDALLVAFAAEVRNDQPREIDRLVPVALTQGRQVRYETIYIQRHRLPTRYLVAQFFPVIISTSQPTQPMLLPLEEWSPELVQAWQEASRKTPPRPATVAKRADMRSFDQAYNDAAARDGYSGGGNAPAPSGLSFGQGGGGGNQQSSSNAYGAGNNYRPQPPAYVDPYTAPSNTYGNGRTFDGSPHAIVQDNKSPPPPAPPPQAPPPPPLPSFVSAPTHAPPPPVPAARAASRLDPAAEAFARNPLQLTPAAIAGLRLSAKQQAMDQFKVRVST